MWPRWSDYKQRVKDKIKALWHTETLLTAEKTSRSAGQSHLLLLHGPPYMWLSVFVCVCAFVCAWVAAGLSLTVVSPEWKIKKKRKCLLSIRAGFPFAKHLCTPTRSHHRRFGTKTLEAQQVQWLMEKPHLLMHLSTYKLYPITPHFGLSSSFYITHTIKPFNFSRWVKDKGFKIKKKRTNKPSVKSNAASLVYLGENCKVIQNGQLSNYPLDSLKLVQNAAVSIRLIDF